MAPGVKVQELLGDDAVKQKAAQRKAESDQILELVYDKLVKGFKKREDNN
jgi:hypothetical protein